MREPAVPVIIITSAEVAVPVLPTTMMVIFWQRTPTVPTVLAEDKKTNLRFCGGKNEFK